MNQLRRTVSGLRPRSLTQQNSAERFQIRTPDRLLVPSRILRPRAESSPGADGVNHDNDEERSLPHTLRPRRDCPDNRVCERCATIIVDVDGEAKPLYEVVPCDFKPGAFPKGCTSCDKARVSDDWQGGCRLLKCSETLLRQYAEADDHPVWPDAADEPRYDHVVTVCQRCEAEGILNCDMDETLLMGCTHCAKGRKASQKPCKFTNADGNNIKLYNRPNLHQGWTKWFRHPCDGCSKPNKKNPDHVCSWISDRTTWGEACDQCKRDGVACLDGGKLIWKPDQIPGPTSWKVGRMPNPTYANLRDSTEWRTACNLCKASGAHCHVSMTTPDAACKQCTELGLECIDTHGQSYQIFDLGRVGFGMYMPYHNCDNCIKHDRPCDHQRPCDSCVDSGEAELCNKLPPSERKRDRESADEVHESSDKESPTSDKRRDESGIGENTPNDKKVRSLNKTEIYRSLNCFPRLGEAERPGPLYYLALGYGAGGVNDPKDGSRMEHWIGPPVALYGMNPGDKQKNSVSNDVDRVRNCLLPKGQPIHGGEGGLLALHEIDVTTLTAEELGKLVAEACPTAKLLNQHPKYDEQLCIARDQRRSPVRSQSNVKRKTGDGGAEDPRKKRKKTTDAAAHHVAAPSTGRRSNFTGIPPEEMDRVWRLAQFPLQGRAEGEQPPGVNEMQSKKVPAWNPRNYIEQGMSTSELFPLLPQVPGVDTKRQRTSAQTLMNLPLMRVSSFGDRWPGFEETTWLCGDPKNLTPSGDWFEGPCKKHISICSRCTNMDHDKPWGVCDECSLRNAEVAADMLFSNIKTLHKARSYFCRPCSQWLGMVPRPDVMARAGMKEAWGAFVLHGASQYPEVIHTSDGQGLMLSGSITKPMTVCACGLRMFGQRMCWPDRRDLVAKVIEKVTETNTRKRALQAVYGKALCTMCTIREPNRPAAWNPEPEVAAGTGMREVFSWACSICHSLVVNQPKDKLVPGGWEPWLGYSDGSMSSWETVAPNSVASEGDEADAADEAGDLCDSCDTCDTISDLSTETADGSDGGGNGAVEGVAVNVSASVEMSDRMADQGVGGDNADVDAGADADSDDTWSYIEENPLPDSEELSAMFPNLI
ncbi:hypothetical protein B0I35DRAFT_15682 [Stachybotrys elegans]|uniref:Uncharacterized protein n=1 Tax=Stachybotrys elegans TaxID=80388 RepID=A0A8K0T1E5_9HYPO|nr:hypothetical protein B0I35DRAFT_15682 [Stachybotrys elegans]